MLGMSLDMKFLALEHDLPGISAAGQLNEPLLKDEAQCAWELYQAGVIRELYFRADRHAAVLVLECANVEEAREALSTLPLVREKMIEFELIPLRPYPGFARLFTTAA
jgi:muconolactone delta-isomerase